MKSYKLVELLDYAVYYGDTGESLAVYIDFYEVGKVIPSAVSEESLAVYVDFHGDSFWINL